MRIIDTHIHLWDQQRGDLSYPWLVAGVAHPVLGDIEAIKAPRYDAAALIAETRFAGVERVVHVEAAARALTPTAEPDWVREVTRRAALSTAMVVHIDLGAPAGADGIAALAGQTDVRGVRDFGVVDYLDGHLAARAFEDNLATMAGAGLLLDLDCSFEHMARAREMAERHPDLTIVLEHIGYPRSRDDSYFASWAPAIGHLARAANVHCKLSGLGMTDRSWTTASLRRWVDTCLETFGPARCLFGSNWPLDRIASSYDSLVVAFTELISSCSSDEQHAICYDNAERLYFD